MDKLLIDSVSLHSLLLSHDEHFPYELVFLLSCHLVDSSFLVLANGSSGRGLVPTVAPESRRICLYVQTESIDFKGKYPVFWRSVEFQES